MHDPVYKRLFSFRRMAADLLRAVGGGWIADVDLDTLEPVPAEYVGDAGQQRRGDAVWRVRFRDRWLHLLVLLEFQSRNDERMALRVLEYTALLYRRLDHHGQLGVPGGWPPVLPVVLYNGDAPWTAALEMRDLLASVPAELAPCQPSQRALLLDGRRAAVDDLPLGNLMRAVVGFEQSRTPADLARAATAAAAWLASPQESELNRAFAWWLRQLVARMGPEQAGVDLGETLEEATMTLAERVAQWPEQWRREGVEVGRREGVAQEHRAALARERALLRRLASARFGDAVGMRVGALLEDFADWDRLAAVGELIVRTGSARELLDGIER